jgi:predicted metal-dependent phosphoesterase TrpH/glycosyltransferase involved in cell wall biosynthesis
VPERYAIAQVAPHPWEDEHEINAFVAALAAELAGRGHRMLVLAPSRSPELVRESRRRIRAAAESPDALFDSDSGVSVLGVGELLPLAPNRRGIAPSPPMAIAATIEEALHNAALDFVHVHEPFAPSAGSVALRHSRALNVGTFHAPAERALSTQVARRFVELFFGRLDARTASFAATRDLVAHHFPAHYQVLRPGITVVERAPRPPGAPVRLAFCDSEERSALRLFLRALRRLPADAEWEATIFAPTGAAPTLRSRLGRRVQVVSADDSTEEAVLAEADVLVAASLGQAPAPGLLLRALGAGVVPVASRVASYIEVLGDGDVGLQFEPGDDVTLASQIERLITDAGRLERLREGVLAARTKLSWSRAADGFEALFEGLAARRHPAGGQPAVRARLAGRPLIDVDLHMHTDHSHDCATPVEALLATARDQGLGAIAVTDHNEISGALDARAKAERFGVKVIVGEEIKTAGQGEVIGLFLSELIPRGMTLAETIAEIRRQDGLVYVPHPFDRLHSVPDYEHLLAVVDDVDAIEVFNPRIAIPAFNEEAARFAAKYRIVGGAGSDSHVAQGLGSVRIRMRDFDGPDEFLESLRDADITGKPSSLYYAQVQALKFLQTRVTPPGARRAARDRALRRAAAGPARKR